MPEGDEGERKVASAWTIHRQAADRAAALHDDRADEAQRKADALAPKLPRLSVLARRGSPGSR